LSLLVNSSSWRGGCAGALALIDTIERSCTIPDCPQFLSLTGSVGIGHGEEAALEKLLLAVVL
jgi:hypothetical protein